MTWPTPTGTTSYLSQQQEPPPDAPNAALRGATFAYMKPRTDIQPELSNGTSSRRAASAAASAGRGQPIVKTSPVSTASLMQIEQRVQQELGNRRRSSAASTAPSVNSSLDHSSISHNRGLSIPSNTATSRARSPSNIAASLAAVRHVPRPQTKDIIPPFGAAGDAKARSRLLEGAPQESRPRSPGQVLRHLKPSMHASERTDSTSIAATTTLVQLFENASSSTRAGHEEKPVTDVRGPAPPLKSPKPIRVLHGSDALSAGRKKPSNQQDYDGVVHGIESMAAGTSILAKPTNHTSPTRRALTSKLNELEHKSTSVIVNEPLNHAFEDKPPQAPFQSRPEKSVSRPEVPPPRKSKLKVDDGTSVSQSMRPPPRPSPQDTRAKSPLAVEPRHPPDPSKPLPKPITRQDSQLQSFSQRRVTPHMTGDSLANAIVGAALASSRAPTPAISPGPHPPLPKRHTTTHHPFHLHHHKSRTPSPSKGFARTTMRTTSSDDEEIISRGAKPKGLFARKHPNKHHEGSRKRWRDEITERERKRYEGLWAANRGLYIPFSATELAFLARHNRSPAEAGKDLVSNLVVRDIWSRSRLPEHMLEEVWDLVDNEGKGRLAREEFVVGLWLIDQRLKGRKLPFKVGESVWASVRTVKGVIVPRKIK